jgi:hypothetical protein
MGGRYQAIKVLLGIGPVLAAVIVAEIGDIARFATLARLCSGGLTPGTANLIPRSAAATSPNRGHPSCGRRWPQLSSTCPPTTRASARRDRAPSQLTNC